jgi:hypothetical protein
MPGKVTVMGLLERRGKAKTQKYPESCSRIRAAAPCRSRSESVKSGSEIHKDALRSYRGLDAEHTHYVVDHAERYVEGHGHTNGLENIFNLLKRGIKDTYVSVEPYHLLQVFGRASVQVK